MSKKYTVTQAGFEKLQSELKELQEKLRPKSVKRLSKARAMGDLAENSEYSAAREELRFLDGRIAELVEKIKNAEVISETKDTDAVGIGDTVSIQSNGETTTYTIVSEIEADISANKLSDKSPIGKAILGAKKGESVEVEAPAGKAMYRIVEIK